MQFIRSFPLLCLMECFWLEVCLLRARANFPAWHEERQRAVDTVRLNYYIGAAWSRIWARTN